MAGDVVAGDVEKVVQAGEEVGGEEGEGVVLDEELLQVGRVFCIITIPFQAANNST